MTLIARFSGTCPECGERWQSGDFIRADYYEPGTLPTWRHAVCPDDTLDALAAAHPICPTCWLDHPEGECDR